MVEKKNNKRCTGRCNALVKKLKNKLYPFFTSFLHTSIEKPTFTMGMYISLVVDNDYKVLRKKRVFIPKYVYKRLFAELIEQYYKISENEEIKRKKQIQEKKQILYNYYEFLRSCLIVLTSDVNEDKKDLVRLLLSKRRIKTDNTKWLKAEVKATELKIKELKESDEKKEVRKTTRNDFANIFQVLHKNIYKSGYDMSVVDYIEAISLFRKEIKELEKIKSR